MTELLNDEENEILQEIINIGMGQVGALLAELLDVFVHLSVPQVCRVDGKHFFEQVVQLVEGYGDSWTGVRQTFYNQLEGEVCALYGADGCRHQGKLMGSDEEGGAAEEERLLEVTNI